LSLNCEIFIKIKNGEFGVVFTAVNEAIIKQKSKSDDQKRSKYDKLVKTETYC